MIETPEQFQQAIEQIERLYQGLDVLRADILPKNPRNFALFAEGPLEQIKRLQKDIDDYVAGLHLVRAA